MSRHLLLPPCSWKLHGDIFILIPTVGKYDFLLCSIWTVDHIDITKQPNLINSETSIQMNPNQSETKFSIQINLNQSELGLIQTEFSMRINPNEFEPIRNQVFNRNRYELGLIQTEFLIRIIPTLDSLGLILIENSV